MRFLRPRLSLRWMIVMVAVLAGAMLFVRRAADPLPADWSLEELDSTVRRAVGLQEGSQMDIRLLAWKTEEDDRPLLVDNALAWCRVQTGEKVNWALLWLFRHPRQGPQWHLDIVYDAPWYPVRSYERPPRNADVYAFLDAHPTGPFFRTNPGAFRVLAAGVRVTTWYSAIGEKPTRFFR